MFFFLVILIFVYFVIRVINNWLTNSLIDNVKTSILLRNRKNFVAFYERPRDSNFFDNQREWKTSFPQAITTSRNAQIWWFSSSSCSAQTMDRSFALKSLSAILFPSTNLCDRWRTTKFYVLVWERIKTICSRGWWCSFNRNFCFLRFGGIFAPRLSIFFGFSKQSNFGRAEIVRQALISKKVNKRALPAITWHL